MDDFKTCSLHDDYHTGCIDCQHDMTEEISILKADNARMREALEMIKGNAELLTRLGAPDQLGAIQICEQSLKGGE